MNALTRRLFLQGGGAFLAIPLRRLGSYAFAIEPGFRLDVTSYHITPPNWPQGLVLKAAVIADIHACEPLMPASRVRSIAELANRLQPDIIFILGDFNAGHRMVSAPVFPHQWGEALSVLKAPLGVYAILGNHDWWHGALPGMRSDGAQSIRRALQPCRYQAAGKPVRAAARRTARLLGRGSGRSDGASCRALCLSRDLDDLPGTLRQVNDDAPVILLAHEPMIFHHVPERVALTLCGHTHGGQVDLPFITEAYLNRALGRRLHLWPYRRRRPPYDHFGRPRHVDPAGAFPAAAGTGASDDRPSCRRANGRLKSKSATASLLTGRISKPWYLLPSLIPRRRACPI